MYDKNVLYRFYLPLISDETDLEKRGYVENSEEESSRGEVDLGEHKDDRGWKVPKN